MTEEEARALCDTVERLPGWWADYWPGENGHYYVLAWSENDEEQVYPLRNLRDWEALMEGDG